MRFISILLIAVIALSGCTTLLGTRLERETHAIQVVRGNCLVKALQIGEVRARHGLPTSIVICFSLRHAQAATIEDKILHVNAATGWHVFWRDESKALRDVSSQGTVLAESMFEFEYVSGMQRQIHYKAVHIYVDVEPMIVFACYSGEATYRIVAGEQYIKILRRSER